MNEIICPNCKKAFKADQTRFVVLKIQVKGH